MLKKFLLFFLSVSFLGISSVYAADDMEENTVKNADVFENNYQNLKESAHVKLSPVEKMFNKKESFLSGNILYQQGYNFTSYSGYNSSSSGRYGADYKLSIGEKLDVYSYGDSIDVMSMSGSSLISPVSKTEVDSNGSIYITGVGPVKAEGRTLGEVEAEVNKAAKKKYKHLSIKLTVASNTGFSVFVYGEVNRPGRVSAVNNMSVLDALGLAGGVKKTGTLRNIKYNKTDIDLYKTLFLGADNNIIVKPNDVIFVDKIGNTAAIKNGVQISGIYELKEGETVKNLISYAGGLLPSAREAEITLSGFDKLQGQKTAKNVPWREVKSLKLSNGDSIEFKELYNGVENTVTIQGNVKHPASYAYKQGMRLSDILKGEDELLEETFITQAVIRRVKGQGNTVETIPVFLQEFFAGMNDPLLEPQDVISIYKSTNLPFVDVYGCINNPKHIPYKKDMTLNDILSDIKFIESNTKQNETSALQETGENGNFVLSVKTQNANNIIPASGVAAEITNKSGVSNIYYLYDIMINSDQIKSIKIAPEDRIFFRTLRENENIKNVKVSGFVKVPGVYSFVKGKKLSDMLEEAGGLTEDADLRGIVYKRANIQGRQTSLSQRNNEKDIQLLIGRLAAGYNQDADNQNQKLDMIKQLKAEEGSVGRRYSGQIALNIKENDINKISALDNIDVQDGDDIYIPRISNHVSVIGEVYNEQSFVYKEKAKARYYIKEVGGYTPNANRFKMYKVGIDGKAEKIGKGASINPGDTIVVPRRIAGNDWISPITKVVTSLANLAVMAAAIAKW